MKRTKAPFKRTLDLSLFTLKRDGLQLFLWTLIVTVFVVGLGIFLPQVYGSAEELQTMAEIMKNPAMIFFVGPSSSFDHYTVGAMFSHFMLLYTGIIVGILNIIFMARYTRGDEEDGRLELVRARPVGHLAPMTSATVTLTLLNLLLGLFISIGLSVIQVETMDVLGSFTFGFAITAIGLFFMALTVCFAQATQSSRGTIGYATGFLLISFFIRGFGEMNQSSVAWLSPLHWLIRPEPYVKNNWFPIGLTILASLLLIGFTYRLHLNRDYGAGLIPEKPGRTTARKTLNSPFSLLLNLQKALIIGWGVGLLAIGLAYGSIFGDIGTFLEENEMFKNILPNVLGYTLEEQFLSFIVIINALITMIPATLITLNLRKEEVSGRLEQLYSRPVTRQNIYFNYVSLAVLTATIHLFLTSLGLYLASSSVMEDPMSFGKILGASMIHLPAVLLMLSIVFLIIGFIPKFATFFWGYYGYAFFTMYLGSLLDLPEWMDKLSPLGYIPQYPVEDVKVFPLILLSLLSIGLFGLGYIGYKNRDIEAN